MSIVVPSRGVEPFTQETLARAFSLDWPRYELIFCVAHADDPVVKLINRAIALFPKVPARLLVGDDRVSGNPKLNNCVKGWEAARHDWVILADSNVLMPKDYVQHLMAAWRPDTGLVCSTPIGSRPDGFWAEVECAFLNTLQARWQYAGEALGLGFAQGKSMLWNKPMLDANGGIRALAAEIAEDAAATKLVNGLGLRVNLVASPFEQPLGQRTSWRHLVAPGPLGAPAPRHLPAVLRARDPDRRGGAAGAGAGGGGKRRRQPAGHGHCRAGGGLSSGMRAGRGQGLAPVAAHDPGDDGARHDASRRSGRAAGSSGAVDWRGNTMTIGTKAAELEETPSGA